MISKVEKNIRRFLLYNKNIAKHGFMVKKVKNNQINC